MYFFDLFFRVQLQNRRNRYRRSWNFQLTSGASGLKAKYPPYDSKSFETECRSSFPSPGKITPARPSRLRGRTSSREARKLFLNCLVCMKSGLGDKHLLSSSPTTKNRNPDEPAKCAVLAYQVCGAWHIPFLGLPEDGDIELPWRHGAKLLRRNPTLNLLPLQRQA